MSLATTDESVVPLLPCVSLETTLDFYQALGFEVTHRQDEPYLYAAVRRGRIELHFSNLRAYGAKNAFGAYLVFVDDVTRYHRAFSDALRERYGKIPTAGLPRITRLKPGHTRFKVFDPSGNLVLYINRDEPDIDYTEAYEGVSELGLAIENAAFIRDTYANDEAAAKVLDAALSKNNAAVPIDRARALTARAELALVIGDAERAPALRSELEHIQLSEIERDTFSYELRAADELEGWLIRQEDEETKRRS